MTTAQEFIDATLQANAGKSEREVLWNLVWSNTRSPHEAVRLLFNAGYRGHELVPPPGWPGTLH